MVIPRIITETMTSMSDRPRRSRTARRLFCECLFAYFIIASLDLNHAGLRDTHTLREATRRQRDEHCVRCETIGIDLERRGGIERDVAPFQVVARAERRLA